MCHKNPEKPEIIPHNQGNKQCFQLENTKILSLVSR